jgi:hypothetical protein
MRAMTGLVAACGCLRLLVPACGCLLGFKCLGLRFYGSAFRVSTITTTTHELASVRFRVYVLGFRVWEVLGRVWMVWEGL